MLLQVDHLAIAFRLQNGSQAVAVDGIDFAIAPGETLALVGESGCGKSATAFSIMRLLPENGSHPRGRIRFDGQDLLELPEPSMRHLRGNDIAMIFQEPMTSLNPLMRIGKQLAEPLIIHQGMDRRAADREAIDLLRKVGIPAPESRLADFPHQLSGGMRQRVMIAMALACRPKLLIADEPTTALDVTIQAQILGLIRDLQAETNMAVLFITHDLGVVNQIADRVCVMYAGRFMETGSREQVFGHMQHPYTRGLFASLPSQSTRGRRLCAIPGNVPALDALPSGCRFRDRCREAMPMCAERESADHEVAPGQRVACHLLEANGDRPRDPTAWQSREPAAAAVPAVPGDLLVVEKLHTFFPVRRGLLRRQVAEVRAVDQVCFAILSGTTLALVGESGCGKTTVGLSILRLLDEAAGTVRFAGADVMAWSRRELRRGRRRLQIVFQDPFSSLSPRLPVGRIVGEALRVHLPHLGAKEVREQVVAALAEVGMGDELVDRYPHEFSGGQRQRISIARALVLKPDFLILDEPTSALDVSVQAQILNLLEDLQARHGLTYLFITHNLAVVRHLADQVAVMYLGRIVEHGDCEAVFARPLHPYTRSLLQAIPSPERRADLVRLAGEVPSPLHPPTGCHFHPRCPIFNGDGPDTARLQTLCPCTAPPLAPHAAAHAVACHAIQGRQP